MHLFASSSQAARLFEEIRRALPRPGLTFGRPPRIAALDRLGDLSDAELLGGEVADPPMAAAVRAGLLLCADRMEESHAVSQAIPTPEGSYWHGILHRREPDYSNAGYWFRRVGTHPLFEALARAPEEGAGAGPAFREATRGGTWDPFRFIELCASAARGGQGVSREELEALQAREIDLLLERCASIALAGGPRGKAP
ncbi:MAG: hypothetical protein HY721_00770 [Planctomycetes bacterium]|nr:hypothetical protein [Planctomycetota bacterium]